MTHRNMGEYAAALSLMQEDLDGCRRTLGSDQMGSDQMDIIGSIGNLAGRCTHTCATTI